MTIKEELKKNYREAIQLQEKHRQFDATDFIEQFIIPEFRKIHQKDPTEDSVAIIFNYYSNSEYMDYYINYKSLNTTRSIYSRNAVERAVNIAKDYDIEAFKDEIANTFVFRLRLR